MQTEGVTDPRTRYLEDGFCVVHRVLPADVVQRASEGMDALRIGRYETGTPPEGSPWNPGDDPNKLCKIEMPHVASMAIHDLVTHPLLGRLAAEVTGATRVQIWWIQLLYKPPGGPTTGTNVGWHQDQQYWQFWNPGSELFTAWVALSDVTADAGPVRFLRGSHRWGFLNQGDFFSQSEDALRNEIRVPPGESWDEVPAVMPPGSVNFHHCLTYHGSGPNLSAGPRRSFAIHMRTENSRPVDHPELLTLEQGRDLIKYLDNPVYNPVIYRA